MSTEPDDMTIMGWNEHNDHADGDERDPDQVYMEHSATGRTGERLRFDRSDTHAVEELRAAETLLRNGLSRALPDLTVAGLLADAFHRWAHLGRLDPDFLNQLGGPETVQLARYILREHQNRV